MTRAQPLESLLKAQPRPNRPVIAVVAGSGQIARYAVQGGADLLIVLSAGYFRNLGTGSLASLMPYANGNEITERLLREQILPSRGNTPIIVGVCPSDPIHPLEVTLEKLRSLGVDGITNWPAAGFYDGSLRQLMELEGIGVSAEVEMLRQAQKHGLAAFGFALEAEAARRFGQAGVQGHILDMGLTRWLEDVQEHRDQLQHAIMRLQEMLTAARTAQERPFCLAFGGPVTAAEDLEQALRQCDIAGFAGGSVFERLPVQEVVTATVRRFKGVGFHVTAEGPATGFGSMIGSSAPMRQVFSLIERVAPHDVNVCIEGETGTGKELVANLLHQYSPRSHGPFITMNCGAIPETLLESELFGHEKGAFTGAHRRRLGKFELANHGTLFMDEIGDLSHHAQVALLRAIQQREITRVGGEGAIPVDARIITASHKSLPQLVRTEQFRSDLFYRLNHITIHLPPLRERQDDIPLLVKAILARLNVQLNRPIRGITETFQGKLIKHAWPGNVRELEHVLRQAALLEASATLNGRFFIPNHALPVAAHLKQTRAFPNTSRSQTACEAVENARGNKSRAAEALGITRKTLYAWLNST